MKIRTVAESDARQLIDLINPIIEDGRFTVMVDPIDLDGQRRWLAYVMKSGVCFVAEEGPRIVGIQSVEPVSQERALGHVGDISTFVSLDFQGMGVGKSLAARTFAAAEAAGFRKLMATIRADNHGAISFYESLGFEIIGTAKRHALIGGVLIDEVLAEIQL